MNPLLLLLLLQWQPGVNFINIKHPNFSYKILFWQLFSSYMYVKTMFVRKIRMFKVDEIDYRNTKGRSDHKR